MIKVRQKASGCLRTLTGAEQFCSIRNYLATASKHGIGFFHALTILAEGRPCVVCHEHGTAVGGFLPGLWDHLNCQLWDHPASLARESSVRRFDRRVRVIDVEVISDGIQGGQRE